jgi:translation initiation factor 1
MTKRLVFSTGPSSGLRCPKCGWPVGRCACSRPETKPAAPESRQVVRVRRTTAGRGGKTVTVISGLEGGSEVLSDLARRLKRRCGVGGTVRDGMIEIQGDQVDQAIAALESAGYRPKRSGG